MIRPYMLCKQWVAGSIPVRSTRQIQALQQVPLWGWYQQDGRSGLMGRSSRPHRCPRALLRTRHRQITRPRHWGWSSLRIAPDLQVPLPTLMQVQRRLGLARIPRPAPPPIQRYKRATPGELVHLAIEKLGRFRRVGHRIHGDHGRRSLGSGSEYLHIAIDDRTRLACAALFPDETAASATAFLALAHRWFAARVVRIHGLLTDNGSGYRGQIFAALLGAIFREIVLQAMQSNSSPTDPFLGRLKNGSKTRWVIATASSG